MPYIGVKFKLIEKNIKDITENTYFAAKPRIIFKSNPIITLGDTDHLSKNYNSGVVYTFKCYCETSYIDQNSGISKQGSMNTFLDVLRIICIKNNTNDYCNHQCNKKSAVAECT